MSYTNKSLLYNNSLYHMIKTQPNLLFIHVTNKKDQILHEQKINPSFGCLSGCIYCTPAYSVSKNILKLHNLGSYYFKEEISSRQAGKKTDVLIFQLKNNYVSKNYIGLNYLTFGQMHYNAYYKYKYIFSQKERENIVEIINQSIDKNKTFIQLANSTINSENIKDFSVEFFNKFRESIEDFPIMGTVYFEALTQTIMLEQDDPISAYYKKQGEFYNWHYKELIKEINKNFYQSFNLNFFNPDYKDVITYIEKKGIISNYERFNKCFAERLISNLKNIFSKNSNTKKNQLLATANSNFPSYLEPLIGHTIHRSLRNSDRWQDLYFCFDQIKAVETWNNLNKFGASFSYNSLIPKGEVGINPAYFNKNEHIVMDAEYIDTSRQDIFVKVGQKLNINIEPRLVQIKNY